MMSFTMPHEVLRAYSSPFPERENGDAEPVTFSLDDLREENLPPETEVASSAIFLLRHIFGSENELVFSVDNGREMDFKLDGSDAIWQVERALDIAERCDYRWAPKRRVDIAVVGIMHDPLLNPVSERKRIDRLIMNLIESPQPPSAIIQHGPRVQLVWKLAKKPTQKQLDDFRDQFHEQFRTVPSDLELTQITPGLRDARLNRPYSSYLSGAVYPPGDLKKMYAELEAPALSAERMPVPEWLKRAESAYDLLEKVDQRGAIGHILWHADRVNINVNPAYSVTWQRHTEDGGTPGLYHSPSDSVENGTIARRQSGDGPEEVKIVKCVPRSDDGANFVDVQVNAVRDLHRALPKMTRFWLQNVTRHFKDEPLKTIAALMLAVGIARKDGIEIMALCSNGLFSEEFEPIADEDEMRRRLSLSEDAFSVVPDPPDPAKMPVDIFEEIKVPVLEEDMVPPALWQFAENNARQIGATREALFVSSLFACAAAISDEVKIKPRSKAEWTESARVWALLIAPPSAKKSPAATLAMKHLQAIDRQRSGAAAGKRAKYELDLKVYKAQEAAYIKAAAKGDNVGDPPVPPEEPIANRLLIMDATPEAVVNITMKQTRGLALYRDELSGWFGSFDAYKGGGKGSKDAPFWMSAYNGESWIVDRVSRAGGASTNVGTSIFGGIQHQALRDLGLQQKRDGMLARFLPFILEKDAGHVGENIEVDGHANKQYEFLIDRLVNLNPQQVDGTNCGPVGCPDAISEQMDDFLRDVTRLGQLEGAIPGAMVEHLGKLEGVSYRLLLIYHCIVVPSPWGAPISQNTFDRVLRLLRDFILPSIDVLYNQLLATDTNHHALAMAQKVARTILAKKLREFDLRQLQQSNRRWFPKADIEGNRMRYVFLNLLRDANWIAPVEMNSEADHTPLRPHTKWKTNQMVWHAMEEHQKAAEEDRRRGWELLQRNIQVRKDPT